MREVHHVALLIGFGAAAVNPYLAMETVEDLVRAGEIEGVTAEKAVANLIKALGKGVLKVMSKMGISTVASYRGAQVFEAIGLAQPLVDRYFTGTVSQARRRRSRRHRPRDGRAPRPGLPAGRRPPAAPHPRGRWRVPVATRGRAAPLRPRDGLPPPALDAPASLRHLQAVHRAHRRPDVAPHDAARSHGLPADWGHRPPARADRGGRAGQRDRQALQHRRDEPTARSPRRRTRPSRSR